MTTPFNAALSAYGAASNLINQGSSLKAPALAGNEQGPDFAKFLSQSVQSLIDTGNKSDNLSLDMVNGKANVVDVVTAVSETEFAMESMVTIRDKVISAYEEIMRMPI